VTLWIVLGALAVFFGVSLVLACRQALNRYED
jgi:hypothetical protein